MADVEVPFLGGTGKDEEPLAGVSDYHGRPVYRSTSGGWPSALFAGAIQLASIFAFIGVSANLITYLTGPLGHSNAAAAAAVNAWSGTACLTPLLGAFVADSWLGRYRSIILACTLYVMGYGMMTLVSTLPVQSTSPLDTSTSYRPSSVHVVLFYASLYLVAVAQGPDSPCTLAFAADQFDPNHPKEYTARSSLFNWWYFCYNTGIAIAIGAVSYVQENFGWGIGFGMLCSSVLCAFIIFLIGTPTYRLHAPTRGTDNPFTLLAKSLVMVVKKNREMQYQLGDEDSLAKHEEAHRVLRMLSIWGACLSYGVVCAQVMTLFTKQGRTLDRRIIGTLELPPAALQIFGPATILMFMPLYECVLVPLLRCATGNPSGLTLLQRLGTGMALSLAAVSTAALIEARRLEMVREHGLVDIPDAIVPMSWLWLVPQYVMIGLGCIFGEVGLQEFFYDQMPEELRSLGLALNTSVMGIGSFISCALISLIDMVTKKQGSDSWFADNLNRAHLDYFYWVLAGLSATELALFLWLANSYTYKKKHKILIC